MPAIQFPRNNPARKTWKKGLLAAAVSCLLLTSLKSDAQSLDIGLKAGANYMKVGGRSFDNKNYPEFNGGVYGVYNFSQYWALQGEIQFSQVGAKTGDGFNQIYSGVSDQKITNDWISVPVMLVFRPVPELSIMLGPQYSFLAVQTTGLTATSGQTQNNGYKAFNLSDVGIVFGGQLNLGKVKFGLRYSEGLLNINALGSTDTWRQYGLQAYLAYQLFDIKLKKKKKN